MARKKKTESRLHESSGGGEFGADFTATLFSLSDLASSKIQRLSKT